MHRAIDPTENLLWPPVLSVSLGTFEFIIKNIGYLPTKSSTGAPNQIPYTNVSTLIFIHCMQKTHKRRWHLNAYINETGKSFICNRRSTCRRFWLCQIISDGFPILYDFCTEILSCKATVKEAANVRSKLLYAILV